MMELSKLTLVCLSSVLLLSACGGGGGDTPLSENSDPLGLNGSWLSNCYSVPNSGGDFEQEFLRFNGSNFSTELKRYSRNDCDGTPDSESRESGSYAVGPVLTTGGGMRANEIDFNIRSSSPILLRDIVRVSGDDLNFGEDVSGDDRPTTLNFSITYRKQP